MAYSSAGNNLNDALRNKQVLDKTEQANAVSALYQDKKGEPEAGDNSQLDDMSSLTNANEAEAMAASNGGSVRSFLRNARAFPGKMNELKQESDKYSGRLALNDGLAAKDIDNPLARKEKFGSNLDSTKGLISDLYRRAKKEKQKNSAMRQMVRQSIDAGESAISAITSELLQQAWLNTLDTYGLSIILYVNFHVFCRFVFGPKIFCKLGHEWIGGKSGGGAAKSATAAKSVSGAKGGSSQLGGMATSFFGLPLSAIGIAEAALLALVDGIILFFVLLNLAVWVIIIIIISDFFKMVWTGIKLFVGMDL